MDESDLTTIYNVLNGDVGTDMPDAGVKHTLLLYLYSWRSPYKQLTWDHDFVPGWWTGDGIVNDGTLTTWSSPEITDSHGDITQYPSWKYKERQWAAAAAAGFASQATTDADNRVILLAAHITCLKLNAYIIEIHDDANALIPNPRRYFRRTADDGTRDRPSPSGRR